MDESFQEKHKNFGVFAPIKNKPKIFYEIIKGSIGRLCKNNKYVSDLGMKTHLVKEFFQERSTENNFNDFTDSSSGWYLLLIENSKMVSTLLSKGKSYILDIGCGRAFLFKWLAYYYNQQLERYLGIDFDELCITKCSLNIRDHRAKFISLDANNIGNIRDRFGKYSLIFCINIFPYINNLELFVKHLFSSSNKETHVIVLDPVPSPYWEKNFGGFSIKIRTPDNICNIFIKNGFIPVEKGSLYALKFFKHCIGEICSLTIFRKND